MAVVFLHCTFIGGAEAQSSGITATICAAGEPNIQLTSPVSDSVVNQREVTVAGNSQRTSQVEIYLNGSYVKSVAIGLNEELSTTVELHEGINTIRLDAYYSCNQTQASFSVIVNYQPDASPSSERPSTKIVPAGSVKPDIVSNPDTQARDNEGIVERVKDNLSFNAESSFVKPIANYLLLIIALIGIIILFQPRYLFSFVTRLFPGFTVTNKWRTAARLVGVLLAVIFATIVQA